MHRSSSNTRVADEFYKSSLSSSASFSSFPSMSMSSSDDDHHLPISNTNGNTDGNGNNKKDQKFRLRSAENAVHLIPLVLLLCAVILWFFSNPVDVLDRKAATFAAKVEGIKAVGDLDIDGTQNNLLSHLELDDDELFHQRHGHQLTETKPSI